MLVSWAVDEMKTASIGDQRLDKRVGIVLSDLGAHPTLSIPAACGGEAETAAAYRFFENDKATFGAVLSPHCERTSQRIAAQPLVLLAQDTTEIDLTRPEQQVRDAGPLDDGPRRGIFLHGLIAFTPDGTPLGTLHARQWARDDEQPSDSSEKQARRKSTPIEDKESIRWLEFLGRAREEAVLHPQTHIVSVADSEADIYELFVTGAERPSNFDWIVRACQDRAQTPAPGEKQSQVAHLRDHVLGAPVLFTNTISVRGRKAKVACEKRGRRQPRESRNAEVEVRAARITLRPPWRPDRKLPPVTVNVVLVREVNPPAGEEPVEWTLLTTLPIDTIEQVRLVIQYYCVRWMIEVFFRTLKSGCRVEERRFETLDAYLPCLAVYMIVAWRTLFVCRLGRACPDISCEAVFEPAEWQSVYVVVRKQPPPKEPPPLQEMVRMIAELGGYVNRKRGAEPGPQTVWLGLQRVHDFARCWNVFGPGAREGG
jgi:Transposase Tn5 dimerisation domain/Transposase DNA-binding/Transposase DDE domain